MPTEKPLVQRCLDCGHDISHRRRDAQRCEPCSNLRAKARSRSYYWENRTNVLQRIKSQQQTPESKQARRDWREKNPHKILTYRQRNNQRHRAKTGYNPEGRTCEECHADISHMGHNAKRCAPCSTPPPRTCMTCHINISHMGARGQFCSDNCKIDAQEERELRGYTKRCTKCKETKNHTEFGLHYKLRRSICKTCEISDQSGRYAKFTSEQRERRHNLRRKRQQINKASQSPAEKTMQRTQARNAHDQRKYGPDFNREKLYSGQNEICGICRNPKLLEELEVDHDHETNRPRGLLCKNCNFKLISRYERFPLQYQDSRYLNAYLSKGKQ